MSAVLDRRVMGLADRGGASGIVGRRWADVAAAWADGLAGGSAPVPDGKSDALAVERVARLDDVPRIALTASRLGMQNPDLLFVGTREGRVAVQAADAKFSVETARSKQVSPEVTGNLLSLGPLVHDLIGDVGGEPVLLPGVFLSPDYPLTHAMMRGRFGIMRATVSADEVVLVETAPERFFAELEGASLLPVLAGVDDLGLDPGGSLLAGLYYFRLARACAGAWLDAKRPLLAMNDQVEVDEPALLEEATARAGRAKAAFGLVLDWDADVDAVRAQRAAVEQVAGLPLMTRELRNLVGAAMAGRQGEAPSANQVRRRVGAWFRGELRAVMGPMLPPVADLGAELQQLGRLSAQLAPRIPDEVRRVVGELVAEAEASADASVAAAEAGA